MLSFSSRDKRLRYPFNISKLDLTAKFSQHPPKSPSVTECDLNTFRPKVVIIHIEMGPETGAMRGSCTIRGNLRPR